MDEDNGIQSRMAEIENLHSQLGDIDARHESGAVTDDEYTALKGKRLAYTAALASLEGGSDEYVSDEAFTSLLTEMAEKAAEPTQTEVNTANIDYLLMLGGEE